MYYFINSIIKLSGMIPDVAKKKYGYYYGYGKYGKYGKYAKYGNYGKNGSYGNYGKYGAYEIGRASCRERV